MDRFTTTDAAVIGESPPPTTIDGERQRRSLSPLLLLLAVVMAVGAVTPAVAIVLPSIQLASVSVCDRSARALLARELTATDIATAAVVVVVTQCSRDVVDRVHRRSTSPDCRGSREDAVVETVDITVEVDDTELDVVAGLVEVAAVVSGVVVADTAAAVSEHSPGVTDLRVVLTESTTAVSAIVVALLVVVVDEEDDEEEEEGLTSATLSDRNSVASAGDALRCIRSTLE